MTRKSVDNVNKITADAPQRAFEAVHAVMHLFRAGQYREFRDGPHAITHLEGKLLGFFARHPDATLSELVTHSGKDKGQLARLIKTLREQGLLEAAEHPSDRRSTRLRLSEGGRAIHQTLRRQSTRLARQAVKGFRDDECAHLVVLLERMKANLEEQA